MITREELKALFDKAGLAHVADDLMAMVKPAIHIKTTRIADETQLPIGASKFGGSPDLPAGFSWPLWNFEPLTFIGQLRMSDVAPYDTEKVLPSTGQLYFFYEIDEMPSGSHPLDKDSCKVLYLADENVPLERLRSFAVQGKVRQIKPLPPCTLELSEELSLPTGRKVQAKFHFADEQMDRYWNLLNAVELATRPMHHLLGHPNPAQDDDMELECQLASNGIILGGPEGYRNPRRYELEAGASDWRLLLQIDTDEDGLGKMWGDAGLIYYWIQRQALQARNFDNCWLIFQCS